MVKIKKFGIGWCIPHRMAADYFEKLISIIHNIAWCVRFLLCSWDWEHVFITIQNWVYNKCLKEVPRICPRQRSEFISGATFLILCFLLCISGQKQFLKNSLIIWFLWPGEKLKCIYFFLLFCSERQIFEEC